MVDVVIGESGSYGSVCQFEHNTPFSPPFSHLPNSPLFFFSVIQQIAIESCLVLGTIQSSGSSEHKRAKLPPFLEL